HTTQSTVISFSSQVRSATRSLPTFPTRRSSDLPRGDHRPDRPQDADQRAQLGREGLHGRLRGRELADLGERRLRPAEPDRGDRADRKSTRLNSSHGSISYAVFCLKKKKRNTTRT